jgi:hypothetical protein
MNATCAGGLSKTPLERMRDIMAGHVEAVRSINGCSWRGKYGPDARQLPRK